MKLEQQVTSLELSKRLKELGVKQESLFYWFEDKSKIVSFDRPITIEELEENGWSKDTKDDIELFSAYTVAELCDILKEVQIYPEYQPKLKKWERPLPKGDWISRDTQADALGMYLIYLLENNLLK